MYVYFHTNYWITFEQIGLSKLAFDRIFVKCDVYKCLIIRWLKNCSSVHDILTSEFCNCEIISKISNLGI